MDRHEFHYGSISIVIMELIQIFFISRSPFNLRLTTFVARGQRGGQKSETFADWQEKNQISNFHSSGSNDFIIHSREKRNQQHRTIKLALSHIKKYRDFNKIIKYLSDYTRISKR